MAETRAHKNKAIRQQALREQLEAQGHVQHVGDLISEISKLDDDCSSQAIQKRKVMIDAKLRLINKYLPDLKSMELESSDSGFTIKIVQ